MPKPKEAERIYSFVLRELRQGEGGLEEIAFPDTQVELQTLGLW